MNSIAAPYNKARATALRLLEQKARKILRRHQNLSEFIMSMGCWGFTGKNGDILHDELHYMSPVVRLLKKWDEILKLTGEPMRFTATGPVIRNW